MDNLTLTCRSAHMRKIKSGHTKPELAVRKALRTLGFLGYRLHRRDLPGRPDIAFIGRRKIILVHGCFWHGHDCHKGARRPKTHRDYWLQKISSNQERDIRHRVRLHEEGWDVLTIWECEVKAADLTTRLLNFLLFLS